MRARRPRRTQIVGPADIDALHANQFGEAVTGQVRNRMSPKNTSGKEKIAIPMSFAFMTAIDCSRVRSGRSAPTTSLRFRAPHRARTAASRDPEPRQGVHLEPLFQSCYLTPNSLRQRGMKWALTLQPDYNESKCVSTRRAAEFTSRSSKNAEMVDQKAFDRGRLSAGPPGQERKKSKRGNKSLNYQVALGFYAGVMGLALLSACSPTQDLPTPKPAIFAAVQDRAPVNAVQPIYKSNDLNLLYVTDRAPIADPETNALSYGSERSRAMSFGSIDIRIEPDSNGAKGEMKLGGIKEIGRFPEVPYPAGVSSAGYRRAPGVVATHEEAVAALQGEIRRRLAKTERKEVVIFIHGYNNSFADASYATGSICRLLGGDFVCVLLTWPAGGSRGAFMGYNVDRESGEFAVADMRKAIRAIGQTEGVRGVRAHRPQPRHRRAGVGFSAAERRGICFALFDHREFKGKEHCSIRAGYRHRRCRDENI